MHRDQLPSEIKCNSFEEWLDYCLIGAEELGMTLDVTPEQWRPLYDRALTPRQAMIRELCHQAVAEQAAGRHARGRQRKT